LKRCNLYVVKGEVSLSPERAPAVDQRSFLFEIEHAFAVVRFPLVPDGPADRKADERMNHAVVEHGRVLVAGVRREFWRIGRARGQKFIRVDKRFRAGDPGIEGLDVG
jgi:hypothetical protein